MAETKDFIVIRSLRRVGLTHLTTAEKKATLCGKPCNNVWWGFGGKFDAAHDCKKCAKRAAGKGD
jgi:hypothetical protein